MATTVGEQAVGTLRTRALSFPHESKGRAPIEALGIWLTLEEAAVVVALLELLPDARESPELTELRDRWQQRIGNRMSEAMTGLSPDGFDAGRAAGD